MKLVVLSALLFVSTGGGTELGMRDALRRHVRALSYPEDSEMGLFFALAIPLDDPVSTKAISVAFFFEANYKLPPSDEIEEELEEPKESSRRRRQIRINRATFYSMLESKFESFGYPGRQCLLRAICETARRPADVHDGLLGDLLRIVLTPSASIRETNLHAEYSSAEIANDTMACSEIYSACQHGIYDYITRPYRNS